MPDIVLRCPDLGAIISTGLSTETIIFETLPDIAIPLRCPACKKIHQWKPKDAWVSPGLNGASRTDLATPDQ